MDTPGFEEARAQPGNDPTEGGVGDVAISIGGDERRMHVRAYNHWVSLLRGRNYPAITDLESAGPTDFEAHGVLLDFTQEIDDPAIRSVGQALRDECALDHTISRISEVPARSVLSRLTGHYLQIIANRAPIGFEAEFVSTRGYNTMYRGILMPFSSDGTAIDFIYGVVNWKEVVGAAEQAQLDAELAAAVRAAPRPAPAPPPTIWADGPSGGLGNLDMQMIPMGLSDRLALARDSGADARAAQASSRFALHRALGRVHDLLLATAADKAGATALLANAGIHPEEGPMPMLKLVFGEDEDARRLADYARVLAWAQAERVPAGMLASRLNGSPGGIRAIVAASSLENEA